MTQLTRRRFLLLSAVASAAACTHPSAGPAGDTGDTGGHSPPLLELSKPPWVQLLGPGQARLRFETREARALPVTLLLPDGGTVQASPTLRQDELDYAWDFGLDNVLPDEPGLYVLQEVIFQDLQAGELYAWQIDQGGGVVLQGSFRAPVAAGDPFRLGWLADTMAPVNADTAAVLAAAAPDLFVHGGDIVYQTSPTDTWNGLAANLASLTSSCAGLVTVGNHEFENSDEIHVMFDRLLMPQGDAAGPRHCAIDLGSYRLLVLDSESEGAGLSADVEGQWEWVAAQLAQVEADPDLQFAIVMMHRPMFTGSKYWVADPTTRDERHAMFRDHGVRLVLCGHVHCYEHWLVEGVHYVVDGGGGALTYDPDDGMAELQKTRPEEAKLRVTAFRTQGVSVVDVASDGSFVLQRLAASDGTVEDRFES